MRPKSAMFYIDQLQDVSNDFVELCRRKRDANCIMPDSHLNDYLSFGIESIALVALDTRLGCLNENVRPENKRAMDAAANHIAEITHIMMSLPTWKLGKWASPAYRRYSKAADELANFVMVSKFEHEIVTIGKNICILFFRKNAVMPSRELKLKQNLGCTMIVMRFPCWRS